VSRGHFTRHVVLAGLVVAGVGLAPAAEAAVVDYIVVLREGVPLQAHLKSLRITPQRTYSHAATGYQATLNDPQYKRVLSSPDVTILTPNGVVASIPPTPAKVEEPPQPPQEPSNGVKRIGGLSSPTAAIDGVDTRIDIDVAVVDTGVEATHPDLNVVGGADCSGKNGGHLQDKHGHGTLVAGFVGAIDNAIGRVGVAPGARIWSVQVTNNAGIVTDGALLCAVDWLTANASTIEIANLSIAGPHPPTENCGIAPRKKDGDPIHAAICNSVGAGITYVVAAGNDSTDTIEVKPASYEEVITVSGISDKDGMPGGLGGNLNCLPEEVDDTFATFSNFGAAVDIAAPASCIGSTYLGGSYAVSSGTSFATPLTAGGAALYLVNNPSASPADVRAALISLAEAGPIPGDPDTFPEGILDVSTL
jgi:subtilisin